MTTLSLSKRSIFLVCCLLASFVSTTAANRSIKPSSPLSSLPTPVSLGTTLVAIPFDGGVVVGADTRTSTGNYVSHRYAHKIVPITDQCVILRSGSAAATQHLVQALQQHLASRSYNQHCSAANHVLSVAEMAHWLSCRVYDESDPDNAPVSLLVAGYDVVQQTPVVYSISPSGALLREERFAVAGSGSSYILGYLDDQLNHRNRDNSILDQKKAVALCQQALCLAMNRDGSSGGLCRIMVLTAEGRNEFTILPELARRDEEKDNLLSRFNHLEGFAPPVMTTDD